VQSISVIIPVYNSEAILPDLVARLLPVLERSAGAWEVILVEDGSRDASWRAVERLASEHPSVHGVQLMRNYGQHNALLCGIRRARFDVVLTMDDDLQHPPEEIPKLLERLNEGHDVVYGTPASQQHGLLRDLASQITKLVLQDAMGATTARRVSALRVFRTSVRRAFEGYGSQFVNIDVLLTWGTTRFSSVVVRHEPRRIGQSNYTVWKLARHALNMMTGFSTFPLQIASFTGFAFTLFGLGVLAYVIGRYLLQGTTVPGFPFLASVIAIFSGAQLFALGIIGEYLARMHFRAMGRPPFAVRGDTQESADDRRA
jgi:undecaprenyl-phosphate 4-deoxy-4-formamido-L-arabinose transferase